MEEMIEKRKSHKWILLSNKQSKSGLYINQICERCGEKSGARIIECFGEFTFIEELEKL